MSFCPLLKIFKKGGSLGNIVIIGLLAVIVILLWKVAYKTSPLVAPVNGGEWMILVAHKIKNAGEIGKATWDCEAPIILEFVPIIAWDCHQPRIIPITPPSYNVWNRLNVNATDKNAKYETLGFWLRDGIAFCIYEIFDSAYMSHGDFWQDMYEYAFSGREFEVRGGIPDCYHAKFAELFRELDHHRAKGESQKQTDT